MKNSLNNQSTLPLPVIGFIAYSSNTGKTTLLKQVIASLKAKGVRVGIVKHCHHEIQIDKPGKDSYELRRAGASQAVLASANGWALMVEHEVPTYPKLEYILARMDTDHLDIVLLEGFRQEGIDKIEVSRQGLGTPLLCDDPKLSDSIIALVSDNDDVVVDVPLLSLNDVEQVVGFVLGYIDTFSVEE